MKLTKDHADYWLSKKSPNVIKDSVDKKSIPSIDSLINSQVKTPINQKNWERHRYSRRALSPGRAICRWAG